MLLTSQVLHVLKILVARLCPTAHQLKIAELEVSMSLFLVSTKLLEHLTELREIFYLLNYWFIIEGRNSVTAKWKRCLGQDMWKECGVSMSSPNMSPKIFTNLEALRYVSFWIFMEASTHRHERLNSLAIGD